MVRLRRRCPLHTRRILDGLAGRPRPVRRFDQRNTQLFVALLLEEFARSAFLGKLTTLLADGGPIGELLVVGCLE